MRVDLFRITALVPALLAFAWQASAGTVVLPALRDNTLIESATGSLSNGAGPYFFAGRTGQASGSIRRGLIAFDVAAYVPAGATVTGVRLTLHLSQTNAGAAAVGLHRVLRAWGEGASSASGGSGAPAASGDATWIHTFFPQSLWTSPGGDFAGLPSASAVVDQTGTYAWGSTPEMVADVQSWLEDPGANHGWILLGDESAATTVKRFDSRENPDAGVRPLLTIEFGRPGSPCTDRGLGGVAFGLCSAYCEELECDAEAPRASAATCERLDRVFRRWTGGAILPCEDEDADGVEDVLDNCPALANADQADGDLDAVGDACDNCPLEPNPGQEDTFGAVGVGDACDCPCFTALDVTALLLALQDVATYTATTCIDTRVSAKPLTAVTARRLDGEPCATQSFDCSALAVEFTEDNVCQLNPPAPAASVSLQGIGSAQREACRGEILAAAEPLGLSCD
jgi:hypothetical protein